MKFLNAVLGLLSFLGIGAIIYIWNWKGFNLRIVLYSIISGLIATLIISVTLVLNLQQYKTIRFGLTVIFILTFSVFHISFSEKRTIRMPYPTDLYLYAGDLFTNKKNFTSAIEEYKKALKIEPDNLNIKRKIAFTFWNQGDINNAIKIQKEIVKNKQSKIKDKEDLGKYYFLKAHQIITSSKSIVKPGEAGKWSPTPYQDIKSLFPEGKYIGPGIFFVNEKGEVIVWGQRELSKEVIEALDKSERLNLEVLNKEPKNLSSHILLTHLYAMKANYEKALNEALICIKLEPNNLGNYKTLIFIYQQLMKEPLIKGGKSIKIIGPDPKKYLGKMEETVELAAKLDHKYIEGYKILISNYFNLFYKGILGTQKHLGEKLVYASEKIIERNSKDLYGNYYLGFGYLLKEKYHESIEKFNYALKLNPDKKFESEIRTFKGSALISLNRIREAKYELEKSLRLNPQNKNAKILLDGINKE